MAWLSGLHVVRGIVTNISSYFSLKCAFSFLGPNTAAYVDLTGSGCETIAHVYENGRITILFNSFDASPRILRLFCNAKVLEHDQPEFPEMIRKVGGEGLAGARAVILLDIFKVQTSCGYGVPVLAVASDAAEACFEGRKTLSNWATTKIAKGELQEYHRANNTHSLDGIPGMKSARRTSGETLQVIGNLKAWLRRITKCPDALLTGMALGVAAVGILSKRSLIAGLVSRAVARWM